MKILGISEKQMIKSDLSVNFLKKKLLLLHFKTTTFFLFDFTVLKECSTFEWNSWIVFSKLLSASNQQLFCITEGNIGQEPSNHVPLLYKLLVLLLWFTLSLGDVKDLQKNVIKI